MRTGKNRPAQVNSLYSADACRSPSSMAVNEVQLIVLRMSIFLL